MSLARGLQWVAVLALLTACQKGAPEPKPAEPPKVEVKAPPPPEPKTTGAVGQREAAAAANDFGFDLWRALGPANESRVISPWAIHRAMLKSSAEGPMDPSTAKVLRQPGDLLEWRTTVEAVDRLSASRRRTEPLFKERFETNQAAAVYPPPLTISASFFGEWLQRFDGVNDQPFFSEGGTSTAIAMMWGRNFTAGSVSGRRRPEHEPTGELPPLPGDGIEILQLTYAERMFSLCVLLPPRGKLRELEQSLTAGRLDELLARPTSGQLADVRMPKFELTSPTPLGAALTAMGMKGPLNVTHEASVRFDENGATVIPAPFRPRNGFSFGPSSSWIRLDHPFLFLIRDEITGAVLVLGRYVGP